VELTDTLAAAPSWPGAAWGKSPARPVEARPIAAIPPPWVTPYSPQFFGTNGRHPGILVLTPAVTRNP